VSKVDDRIEGRLIDPLVECVAELSRRYSTGLARASLDQLPRDAAGRLPAHQAGAALETAGVNFEPVRLRTLPRGASRYPALVNLRNGDFMLILEVRESEVLAWRPFRASEEWEPFRAVASEFGGLFLAVYGDPDKLREAEAPWHAKGRGHWFWSELRKERQALSPVLLASLVINVLAIALPLFTMNVYDRVIPNRAGATLWVLAIGVILAFSLEFALRRARTAVIDDVARQMDMRLSQKIFSRLLATPLEERRGHTGALAARVSEYAIVREFYTATTIVLLMDMAFLVVFVGIIAILAGWLALVPMVIIAAMVVAGFALQRKVVTAAQDAQADYGLQQTLLVESLAGIETLKSMAGEGGMISRWHRLAEIGGHSQQRLRNIASLAVGLAQVFQQVSTIALIIGGYYLFAAGEITMGAIIAIVMLASRSLAPAAQIAFLLTRGRQAHETLDSIERLFEGGDERKLGSSLTPSHIKAPTIRLENVEFRYPGTESSALTSIGLEIRPGERIAVVGRVASGKSTLGRILCGIYQPTDGSVLIDGIDSRQYRPQQVREALRFVGQDAALFTGSVKDNLSLGRETSDDRLIEAMRATGADAFLTRDAGGFDRAVGEGGRSLSGGQRAFLALTRAVVSPSELLFLDEPTGAMDSQTEKHFVERLSQSLTEEQTLVIATHRPALFALCRRLIVLDKGRIVADGPIQEVVSASAAAGSIAL
jgi:ATP-binding cassette, subfamily C, bacterial LapB